MICKRMQQTGTLKILNDVLGNVIYCFVGNITYFPAVKNYENRLRSDEIILTIRWRVF